MLWPHANLNEVYDNIKEQSLGGGCSVLIFVAMDCDALCSCQIITQLLRSDHIAYKIKPVNGAEDIRRDYEVLLQGNDTVSQQVACISSTLIVCLLNRFGP